MCQRVKIFSPFEFFNYLSAKSGKKLYFVAEWKREKKVFLMLTEKSHRLCDCRIECSFFERKMSAFSAFILKSVN